MPPAVVDPRLRIPYSTMMAVDPRLRIPHPPVPACHGVYGLDFEIPEVPPWLEEIAGVDCAGDEN